ncbi:hypothetical protein LCM20_12510 [Halobacillus litoralis]|uniref:hypothetical protein n=1 Tax=Halobacillus litoralis TaxID=45668 RepID=UPI001CD27198|nr:hypothetical protein [Halobacillus litoralis]MCA0971419.1 hypothetical protein [Halobacillus litoralis]
MFGIILFGMFVGVILFVFTLIAVKKVKKLYLAPLVPFLAAVLVTAYGLFKVGGFEGMAYGFLGAGMFIVGVIGIPVVPLVWKKMNNKSWSRIDGTLLIALPIVLFASIGWVIASDENYWIIEEGTISVDEGVSSYYRVDTILEGRKQVFLTLGDDYAGTTIEVEKVKVLGNTEVLVNIRDNGSPGTVPFISIGVDQINEPLEVKSTDGEVFQSALEQKSE